MVRMKDIPWHVPDENESETLPGEEPFTIEKADFERLEILYTKTMWGYKVIAQHLNWNCNRTLDGKLFPFNEDMIRKMLLLKPIPDPSLRRWSQFYIAEFKTYYKQVSPGWDIPWQGQIRSRLTPHEFHKFSDDDCTALLEYLWRTGDIRLLYGEKLGPDVRNMMTWPNEWVEFFAQMYSDKHLMPTAQRMKREYPDYEWAWHSRAVVMAQVMTFRFPEWYWNKEAAEKGMEYFREDVKTVTKYF